MFDRYAAATAPSWGRRALIAASIILHASAGIALFIYTLFHVEEIAPPAVSLTFFSAPPPPPPPPPPAGKKATHVEIKKPIPTEVVQPKPNAIVQPKKDDTPPPKKEEPDGEEGGQVGGVAGGTKGGTVGGTIGGTIGGTVGNPPAPSGGGKMVAGFTLAAMVLNAPDPHLPDEFKDQHKMQTVRGMYKVCLANDGSVSDVTAMTAIPGMDSTIIQQIKSTWKYKPQPLPVCFAKPFAFKIN